MTIDVAVLAVVVVVNTVAERSDAGTTVAGAATVVRVVVAVAAVVAVAVITAEASIVAAIAINQAISFNYDSEKRRGGGSSSPFPPRSVLEGVGAVRRPPATSRKNPQSLQLQTNFSCLS